MLDKRDVHLPYTDTLNPTLDTSALVTNCALRFDDVDISSESFSPHRFAIKVESDVAVS